VTTALVALLAAFAQVRLSGLEKKIAECRPTKQLPMCDHHDLGVHDHAEQCIEMMFIPSELERP
jgi:hypothetical protein